MSRAHMIYDDKVLSHTAAASIQWPEPWRAESFYSGNGVIVEGKFAGRSRNTVTDSTGAKHRHLVIIVEATQAFSRQFNADGSEIAVIQQDSRKVRTGYLNSSYKTEKLADHRISLDEAHSAVDGVLQKILGTVPCRGATFQFWGDEDALREVELTPGCELRLSTRGNSPFIDSLALLETTQMRTATNFTGSAAVGESWTDKLVSVGAAAASVTAPQEELEGVDDDEWDD
eukprot:m.15669 g.15669  ORF g.15669 m.15669 type:complete len:230 (-) comp3454_c0_seq2:838-1527(-)